MLSEIFLISYFLIPNIMDTPAAFLVIKSDSMLPTLKPGSFVLINGRDKDLDNLISQVIAFYDPTQGRIIVHRAIGLEGHCLLTKGDNAPGVDFFKPTREFILGKVVLRIF